MRCTWRAGLAHCGSEWMDERLAGGRDGQMRWPVKAVRGAAAYRAVVCVELHCIIQTEPTPTRSHRPQNLTAAFSCCGPERSAQRQRCLYPISISHTQRLIAPDAALSRRLPTKSTVDEQPRCLRRTRMSHIHHSGRTLCQSAMTASSTQLSLSSLHSWLYFSSSRCSSLTVSRTVLSSSSASSSRSSFLQPRRSFAAPAKKDAKKGAKKEEGIGHTTH